jgi:DNA anti-recombination protein RmuC
VRGWQEERDNLQGKLQEERQKNMYKKNNNNNNNNNENNDNPIDEVKREVRKEIDELVNIQKQGLSKLVATLPAKMQAEIFRRFKKMDRFIEDLQSKINDLKNREDFLEEDNQRLLAKYNEMFKMYTEEADKMTFWNTE